MTDLGTGANPDSTYTLSSGEAAKAELRELREVAEELAMAVRIEPGLALIYRDVLARYEALRDG